MGGWGGGEKMKNVYGTIKEFGKPSQKSTSLVKVLQSSSNRVKTGVFPSEQLQRD